VIWGSLRVGGLERFEASSFQKELAEAFKRPFFPSVLSFLPLSVLGLCENLRNEKAA
jgi:hypothetical protein